MDSGMKMYEYHLWAHRRMLARLKEVPGEVVTASIQSVFPSIYATLVHQFTVENAWLMGMQGLPFEEMKGRLSQLGEETQGRNICDWEALSDRTEQVYRSFLAGEDLEKVREFPHPTFGTLKASLSEILHHIANHGTYHRGHICAMLRQQGYAGAPTDYVFYLMEGKP